MRTRVALLQLAALLACASSAPAHADDSSGVSPNRLHLPKGPGSLGGVGENVTTDLSMGLMRYAVPIALPGGYQGMTPSLALQYSSGAGNSSVGLGWQLAVPTIERMTARGLPRYNDSDLFAAGGSEELVRMPDGETYRARFEGGFVRYRFVDPAGTGAHGHWIAEYPDGRIGYFGADADGRAVASARVEGDAGTFRYHLVERVDALGHRIRFEYERDGQHALPVRVAYAFEDEGPRYVVNLGYEDRPDHLSDGKPGFELRSTRRLAGIQVLVRGQQLRRYDLDYDAGAGLSRLSRIEQYGVDDAGPFPMVLRFGYSGGLGDTCLDGMCNAPQVVELEADFAGNLQDGSSEFVDLNGDALPDLVDTSGDRHRIHLNVMDEAGQRFAPAARSEHGTFPLAAPHVQLLDVDGDGFADMVNAQTRGVLYNRGGGDWARHETVDMLELPDFAADANLRMLDFDFDKRIDVLHTDGSSTWYHRSLGDGRFEYHDDVPALDVGVARDGVQLADMNGDGLQDLVVADGFRVRYRMSLGHGRFAEWIELDNVPEVPSSELQLWDLNGDGLADAVHVAGSQVRFALNRGGRAFERTPTVLAGSASLPIPAATPEVSVRFADMNGSGSTDIVWLDGGVGRVTYLELFPHRPNLLTRIENGLGRVTELAYGSSVEHMVRSRASGESDAWRLPHPVLTVDRVRTTDGLTGLAEDRVFHYQDGYYDGDDKQFRGFARVEAVTAGDDYMEPGRVVSRFDVGDEDRYRHGLLLSEASYSDGRPIAEVVHSYDECAVGGVPDDPSELERPVRHVCRVGSETTVKEGLGAERWVTVEETTRYDAFGNPQRVVQHGVTAIGGQGCGACAQAGTFGAPCGRRCLGDERITRTNWVPPDRTDGRWMLRKPAVHYSQAAEDGEQVAVTRYHYDGEPFEGLPSGELTLGLQTRVEVVAAAEDAEPVQTLRVERDRHGAVIASMDADGHRRSFVYDQGSLLVRSESVLFEAAQRHAPYALTIGVRYHPIHETIVASSPWVRTAGARAPPLADVLGDDDGEARYRYDDFGRLVAVASPGDRLDTPTASFDYQLRAPVSRIIHRRRSRAGGPADLEEIKCFDGMGRSIQTRKRIAEGKYQVSGLIAYNRQGKQAVAYQPYFEADGRCDRSAPADGHKTETTYDALGRVLTLTHPDADLFDGNSVARTHYEPLREIERDPEDADAGSEHADTPLITERDGLGRTVALTRHLVPGDPIGLAFFYDGFGNLHGVRDGHGNEKWQFHDALGRITEVRDPDAGVTTYRRDGRGNAVAITDGRGETTNNRYDEASRLVATWDAQDEAGTRVDLSYDVAPTDCEACSHVAGRLGFATYSLSGASLGLDAYGYDRRGRTTYRARTLDGHTFETRVRFDNADRPVATTYPGGHVLERRFDGVDRVVAVPGFVLDMGYAAHGPVETLALDNGVTTRHRYDDRGRLAGMETELVGRRAGAQQSTSLQAYRYLRDRVGNIIAVGDGLKGGGRPSAEARYRYDALYRLVEAHLDPLDGEHAERLGYRYDTLDNLLERSSDREDTTVAVGRFEYGQGLDAAGDPAGPHAATRLGETKIVYDAAGHVLAQGDRGFGWDHAGRLTEVTRDGQLVSELDYGHGSQRVKKAEDGHVTYYVGDGFEVRDGVATLYVEVAGQRVARVEYADAPDLPDLAPVRVEPEVEHERDIEHEPDGSINAADAWVGRAVAAGVFASDTEVSADDVRAILAASARQLVRGPEARVTFFHHDHLGTTVLSTDIEGRVLQRSAHYPYGGVRSASGYLEDYAFTGAEYDRQSDLSYHSARYLSPALGRWSAPDPLFATLSANTLEHPFEAANPYAYARNNPVLRVDAQGELAFIPLIFLAVNVADRAYAAYEAYQIYKDIRSGRTTLAKLVKGRARDKLEERVGGVVFGKLGGLAARGLSWLRKNRGRARRDAPDKESKNGGCNCFAAGTLVQTADGLQPIEQLSVGDRVLSKDPKTGAEDVRRVTRTFITPNRPVLKLELAGADGDHTDQVIHATPGHPFWVRDQGFRPAADLTPGTELYTTLGNWVRVKRATWVATNQVVYNLEVEDFHTYFVGDPGVWVHNTSGQGDCSEDSGGEGASRGGAQVATNAAKAARMRAALAAEEIRGARAVGSALKSDKYHRAASFAVDDIAEHGTVFALRNRTGTVNLTQVPGELNGVAGRFEWIVDQAGQLTHQMFVAGGRITGVPIRP